jgi:hypothetical protein
MSAHRKPDDVKTVSIAGCVLAHIRAEILAEAKRQQISVARVVGVILTQWVQRQERLKTVSTLDTKVGD